MTQRDRMAQITKFMIEQPQGGRAQQTGSAALAGPLKRLTDQDYAEMDGLRAKVLELTSRAEKVREIDLTLIDDSPYQSGPLSEKRVQQLEGSLRENPWGQPILVREKADGRFETIAGHHRREAMARLGHKTIEAMVKSFTDDEAQRLVIYDNLLAPDLSAWERYRGLAERSKTAKLSRSDLARESGLSKQYISVLMSSFEDLPQAAHDLLRSKPDALSAPNGAELSRLCQANEAVVLEAVRRATAEEMDGSQAVRWAKEQVSGKQVERAKPVRTVVKSGKHNWAEIVRTDGQIKINLVKNPGMSKKVEGLVLELLDRLSKE